MSINIIYHVLHNAKKELKSIATSKQDFKHLKKYIYNYINKRAQNFSKSELVDSTMYQFNIHLNNVEYVISTFKNGKEYWILRISKYKPAKEYYLNNIASLGSIIKKVSNYLRPKLRIEQNNLDKVKMLRKLNKEKGKYLTYKEYYQNISHCGWTPIDPYHLIGLNELVKNNYSHKYIDKFFSRLLVQHNKKILNQDLSGLIHNLNGDISIKLIKFIVNINDSKDDKGPKYKWFINNIYKLFPDILFPVLEHILYLNGISSSGKTSKLDSKVIVGEISRISKDIDILNNTIIPNYDLLRDKLLYRCELISVEYLYKSYNNNQNNDQTYYSRNSILHGRFNLSRVRISDYLKLLLLCYNLSLRFKKNS